MKIGSILFALVVLAFVVHWLEPSGARSSAPSSDNESISAPSQAMGQRIDPPLVPATTQPRLESSTKDWLLQLPNRTTVLNDGRADSRVSPRSIRELIPRFTALIQVSRLSPDIARDSFAKFEACAVDANHRLATPLKTLCFQNAAQIARLNPVDLASRLYALRSQLDPRTRRLIQAYENL